MRRVFVDAFHYIAVLLPSDGLHETALRTSSELAQTTFVTTDLVFVEVLAYVAERGVHARREALGMVRDLRADSGTTIVRMSEQLFDAGLDLYGRRLDKGYSLTDCVSMVVCKELAIEDVLTHDRHFAQEGFGVLL